MYIYIYHIQVHAKFVNKNIASIPTLFLIWFKIFITECYVIFKWHIHSLTFSQYLQVISTSTVYLQVLSTSTVHQQCICRCYLHQQYINSVSAGDIYINSTSTVTHVDHIWSIALISWLIRFNSRINRGMSRCAIVFNSIILVSIDMPSMTTFILPYFFSAIRDEKLFFYTGSYVTFSICCTLSIFVKLNCLFAVAVTSLNFKR